MNYKYLCGFKIYHSHRLENYGLSPALIKQGFIIFDDSGATLEKDFAKYLRKTYNLHSECTIDIEIMAYRADDEELVLSILRWANPELEVIFKNF